jgi:hypothetical protein
MTFEILVCAADAAVRAIGALIATNRESAKLRSARIKASGRGSNRCARDRPIAAIAA